MAELHDSFCGGLGDEADFSMAPVHKDKGAKIQKCPPVTLAEEDEQKNGYGFWANLYCPYCGEACDFILIDFQNPFNGTAGLKGINMAEWGEDLMRCPKCGYRNLEFV